MNGAKISLLSWFLCTIFLTGCTAAYKIRLNGYLDEGGENVFEAGARFHILEGEYEDNPILAKKTGEGIRALLEEAGFKAVSLEEADFGIRFRFGSSTGVRYVTEYVPGYWGPYPYCHWSYGFHTYYGWYGGGRVVTYSRFDYNHLLILQVFDAAKFREDQSMRMIWVGEAASRSPTPDLRTAIAYLLRALFDLFGEDTKSAVDLKIKADDPRVQPLK